MKKSALQRRTLIKVRAKAWKRELDELCRRACFARDQHRCQKTGESTGLQWCHIRSRRYLSTRWRMENVLTLTAGQHLWWHHNPLAAALWFQEKFPDRARFLLLAQQTEHSFDREATKLYLQQELDKYA